MKTPEGSCFFSNTACEYYPCHEGVEEINCLFCFCPLYHLKDCPGTPEFKEKNNTTVKVCKNCTFPHKAEHYPLVCDLLKQTAYRE